MNPLKLKRDLKCVISNKLKNVNIPKLLSLKLIKQVKATKTNYKAPQNAPIWAARYKFTRKKYKMTENDEVNITYILTTKGKRKLKDLMKN